MFTQRGEVCSPYENVTSLPGGIKTKERKVIESVIKAKIMGLSTPGTVNLMAKYHINVCP